MSSSKETPRDESKNETKVDIYAKMNRRRWLESLSKEGRQGLVVYKADVFIGSRAISNNDKTEWTVALSQKWWDLQTSFGLAEHRFVCSEIPEGKQPGMYKLRTAGHGDHAQLPQSCMMHSIMQSVTELLQAEEKEPLQFVSPIAFATGRGGFSWKYMEGGSKNLYTCFLFLGGDGEEQDEGNAENTESTPERNFSREHAAVLLARENHVREFSGRKAVTLNAVYTEGSRKFFMHVGDILIVKGTFSFALNLPMDLAMPGAIMMSWSVVKDGAEYDGGFPNSVDFLHDVASENKAAAELYKEEEAQQKNKSKFDFKNRDMDFMERLRVTPRIYLQEEVNRKIEKSSNIFNITSNSFINGK